LDDCANQSPRREPIAYGHDVTDQSIREDIARLASIGRGSGTAGEAQAAEMIAEMLRSRGVQAPSIERERAVEGFWLPTGIAACLGVAGGVLGARRRWAGALLAAGAAALMADDVDAGPHLLRRLLPKRATSNVLGWCGDPEASETLVLIAHHDAAHTGLLFHPGLVPLVNRLAPRWYEKQKTSTQTGRLLVLGPALTALGALFGSRAARRAGIVWSAGTAALLADVGRSPVVDGANDNLSAVAVLLAIAEQQAGEPVRGLRVLLLSTGSEETFMEGMRGFVARHRDELDVQSTRFLALECVGSPHLLLLEGEGMLRMRDYDEQLRDELQAAADELGLALWRGLRLGAGATDALSAMRAGYRAACLAACNELKVPANYHWKTDTLENLSWETIDQAARVVGRFIERAGAGATVSTGGVSVAGGATKAS
jgi:peptidase M28-like protein